MDDIASSIEEYNKYVRHVCSTIFPFDIWYEHTTGNAIPKEWQSHIVIHGDNNVAD